MAELIPDPPEKYDDLPRDFLSLLDRLREDSALNAREHAKAANGDGLDPGLTERVFRRLRLFL